MAAFSDGTAHVQQGLACARTNGSVLGRGAGVSARLSTTFGCVRWCTPHSPAGVAFAALSTGNIAEMLLSALWLLLHHGVGLGLLCPARSCGVLRYMRLGASWLSPLLVLILASHLKKSAVAFMVLESVLCFALMMGAVAVLTLPPAVVSADVAPRGRASSLISVRCCGVLRYMRLGASWLSPLLVLILASHLKKSAVAFMVLESVLCFALMMGAVAVLTLPPAVVSADVAPCGCAPACTVVPHLLLLRQRTSAALQTTFAAASARWCRLSRITSALVGAVVAPGRSGGRLAAF